MSGYKLPSFQDRAAASLKAKQKALETLKQAPRLSEAEIAERAARQAKREAAREAAAREKAEKLQAAREEKKRLAEEKRAAAVAALLKATQPKKTEAELKAARDARYAARKNRK